MSTTYKYASAHEWLGSYLARIDDPEELRRIIHQFAVGVDSDTIQDLFEKQMDADGYFDAKEN